MAMREFALALAFICSCKPARPAEEMRRASWGEPSYEIVHNDGRGTELGMRGDCGSSPFPMWLYYLPPDREQEIRSYLDAGDGALRVSVYVRARERFTSMKALASGPDGKPRDFTPALRLFPEDASLPASLPEDACESVVRADLRERR
ncbi:MAG TPA: hypothetical protein VLD37_07540 [Candidatus Bilamarchaeum sp.]|nr:hypothetical protein [Candidatus Bilamarchaeum sp.]